MVPPGRFHHTDKVNNARDHLDLCWVAALAGAALVHGALVAALLWGHSEAALVTESAHTPTAARTSLAPARVAAVQLIDERDLPAPRGALVMALLGAGDVGHTGAPSHPLPRADRDLPGQRAAAVGGGAPGGSDTWTGRRDDGNVRQQIWNDPTAYRLPRTRTADRRRSKESIVRAPSPGFGARRPTRRRARTGATRGRAGAAKAAGTASASRHRTAQPRRDDANPLLSSAPARRTETARAGSTRITKSSPLVDRGALATDATRKARAVDNVTSAAASSERNPMPMDLLHAQSGGTTTGMAGPRRGIGPAARGVRGSSGSGATTAAVRRGPARISVRARRQLPYFRSMYRRVDRLIQFPRDLALSMAQGVVVARFTLLADGRIRHLAITKTSGYDGFDRQVRSGLTRAAPFGKVPSSILRGRRHITVVAPFEFTNPLIR